MSTDFKKLLPENAAHFINNSWVSSKSSDPVTNPATGETIAQVAMGSKADADKAVAAAKKAQKKWAAVPQPQRAEYLYEFARQIEKNKKTLATLLTTEQGKPLAESEGEVDTAILMLRFYAGLGWKRTGHVLASNHPHHQAITKESPLGVVAAIIPWNFPLAIFARKTAPALLAGNTIVVKPSENTPLCSLALATLSHAAGIPNGVINVICGEGSKVGDALVKHPDVELVTMTGSTRAGKIIAKNAAEKVIPVSLELGGKAPFIVLADADIEKAAQDAIDARMANCGQVCICNERTYIQREAYEPFMRALKKAAEKIIVGDPLAKKTTMGPKVSAAEKEHVEQLLAQTKKEGGNIFWQGKIPDAKKFKGGNWVAPTIVTDLPAHATILKEEAFGPILPVVVFDTIDEVIRLANDCEYGLSSYLYTRDLLSAMQISDALEYGEVYINRYGPEEINGFHAGWKLSGIGGDDGEHGYQLYVKQKTVYLNYQS
ncbi:aldehyde dehydrogenase family protein [Rosenbergiella australiborealis]|uniref:aldehyde dehydrogenase family protein n=1 Tax=Rosenbergiella australiborealis TaxID=1544696 RepID=UPI001F4D939C|nr:aldehyde dehydrogenase family protein [Rosenbergiella australiborealis]